MPSRPSPFTLSSTFYFYLFFTIGCTAPFFPLWFKSIGITEQQVGIIAASPSFVMVLTTVFIGGLADRAKDWRSTLIVCNWLVAILVTGLLFVTDFYGVLIIWTLTGILLMAISPILDAATIRMANSQNTHFHKMRAFGSAGFIVAVLFAGQLFDRMHIGIFVYLIISLAWIRALLSHTLPYFKSNINLAEIPSTDTDTNKTPTYRLPWFLLVLFSSALIHASHAYFYTFGSLIWVQAGYSTQFVSILWALGVVIEVIVMWRFAAFAKRYSARALLIIAGSVAITRWIIFGFNPGFYLLLTAQILHGLTFALMFLATINFIANWTPVKIAARAQALSATLNTGCMALTTVGSGYLHVASGEKGYWLMAALCLLAIVLIAFSFRLSPNQDKPIKEVE